MPRHHSRRGMLAATTASLAGLAGCSLLQSGERRAGTTIVSARISTSHPEPRTVSVLFERDGDVVYWRQFSVPGDDPRDDVGAGASVPVDSLTDEPSVWTVRAFDHHTGKFEVVTLGREVDPETRVMVTISENDRLAILNSN